MIRKCLDDFWSTPKSVFCKAILYKYWQNTFWTTKLCKNRSSFLAPPAERQRSFSNADSSVVRRPSSSVVVVRRRPSSSVVNFSIKSLISQKLFDNFFSFWHVASLGWYQCIVKIWIWLNHPKGHFKRSERSNLARFLLGGNFL